MSFLKLHTALRNKSKLRRAVTVSRHWQSNPTTFLSATSLHFCRENTTATSPTAARHGSWFRILTRAHSPTLIPMNNGMVVEKTWQVVQTSKGSSRNDNLLTIGGYALRHGLRQPLWRFGSTTCRCDFPDLYPGMSWGLFSLLITL